MNCLAYLRNVWKEEPAERTHLLAQPSSGAYFSTAADAQPVRVPPAAQPSLLDQLTSLLPYSSNAQPSSPQPSIVERGDELYARKRKISQTRADLQRDADLQQHQEEDASRDEISTADVGRMRNLQRQARASGSRDPMERVVLSPAFGDGPASPAGPAIFSPRPNQRVFDTQRIPLAPREGSLSARALAKTPLGGRVMHSLFNINDHEPAEDVGPEASPVTSFFASPHTADADTPVSVVLTTPLAGKVLTPPISPTPKERGRTRVRR